MKKLSLFFILAMSIWGCNEQHPFEPEFSNDTNWQPRFDIIGNNYQRLTIKIFAPSEAAVLRTAETIIVLAQSEHNAIFDTLGQLNNPFSNPSGSGDYEYYITGPKLLPNTLYTVTLAVRYRNGAVSYSWGYSLVVTKDPHYGSILKRIPVDNIIQPIGTSRNFIYCLAYDTTQSYRLSIMKVDTMNGSTASILEASYSASYAVFGDTLAYYNTNTRVLSKISLTNLQTCSQVLLDGSYYEGFDLTYDGTNIWFLHIERIVRMNALSGKFENSTPTRPNGHAYSIPGMDYIMTSGGRLWVSTLDYMGLDNRIIRLDSASLTNIQEYRNPIFFSKGAVWDNGCVWTLDTEHNELVKFRLEGL